MARHLRWILPLLLVPTFAFAQVDGRQVIVSPDGLREAEVAGSTDDALKVICVDGSCTGGGGGTQDVNIVEVGGNAVTTTIPVSAINLDIRDLVFGTDKVDVSGSTVTANQGTPASTANRWPVQITDGTDLALVTAGGSLNVECTAGCTPGGSFADNAAFTFGTTAINISGFVFDDTAPNAATENSAAAPRMSGNRVPYSTIRDAAGNERGANVNAANELLVVGPQTDVEDRAGQLTTGTLNGSGQNVTLALNGSQGASAGFALGNDFDGTVEFQASFDAGATYRQIQANSRTTWDVSHASLPDVQPSNNAWAFALAGGETHVRVASTSYVAGSVLVTMSSTKVSSSPVHAALFPGGGGSRPGAAVLIGGTVSGGTDARTPNVRGDNDGANDQGFVVRDMQGGFRLGGAMTGSVDFGKGIGGRDAADAFVFAEFRDTTPGASDNGLVVRNIPSGTQTVTGTVTTGGLTDAELRATPVPISGTVTANAGTDLNTSALNLEATQTVVAASLSVVDDWDESDRVKVNPIVGQAGVQAGAGATTANTQRVALATDANTVAVSYTALTGNAPGAATVGVASAQCLASNANRKAAFFVNTSVNTISIAESGQAAVLNSGITLPPGAAYSMVPPFVTTGQVNCIAAAASSNLSTLEKQ